jgi:hypothetical protein
LEAGYGPDCQSSTIFAGWRQLRHTMENSFCGGPVCRQTRLLLVLPVEVASFYEEAIQDESTYQEPSTGMSTCLDSSNTIYSDCLQEYTQLPLDRKTRINVQYSEYYLVVESMVQWQDESFPTWITTSPVPDLADSSVTTRGKVYISTVDMHMPSAVRPIRRHEWCRLLGFGEEYRKKIYNFKPEAVDFLL